MLTYIMLFVGLSAGNRQTLSNTSVLIPESLRKIVFYCNLFVILIVI